MSLQDLLRTLPKHERDRLLQVAGVQRDLLDSYASAHQDILRFLQSVLQQAQAARLKPSQAVSLFREAQAIQFIESRIATLDAEIGLALSQIKPRISDLVVAQVSRELTALGYASLSVTPPDPRLLESKLEYAVSKITQWNGFIRRDLMNNLRLGILKGEDYHQLSARLAATRTAPGGQRAPIAKASSHMLANTRYAVVSAANGARQDAYRQSAKRGGFTVEKMWHAAIKTCCISCASLHGTVVPMGKNFPWKSMNLTIHPLAGRLPHPPLHPNCRCRIIPITSDFDAADLSKILDDSQTRVRELSSI